ncbi:hypothetical protein [Kitasatospora sp. NPDC004289]
MSRGFAEFLLALQSDGAMLRRYCRQDLHNLVACARGEGFDFTPDEARSSVLALESAVALGREGQGVDSGHALWLDRWGTTHLEYLVGRVAWRFTGPELHHLLAGAP